MSIRKSGRATGGLTHLGRPHQGVQILSSMCTDVPPEVGQACVSSPRLGKEHQEQEFGWERRQGAALGGRPRRAPAREGEPHHGTSVAPAQSTKGAAGVVQRVSGVLVPA